MNPPPDIATYATMKDFARRLALLLAGTVTALLLVEALMQTASLFVRDTSRGIDPSTGRMRVLCLGDSNTYGLAVERNQSYPARLEALWNSKERNSKERNSKERNAKGLEPGIEVFNLGYPGTNSSQVLRDFQRNLDLFEPRIVLVEVGSNDFWTVPVAVDAEEPWSLAGWIRRNSRLYKLLYMATRSAKDADLVVETAEDSQLRVGKGSFHYQGQVFELGHEMASTGRADIFTDLERNLTALTELARTRHVQLVFVTYASAETSYRSAGNFLAKVANATGTPLVDLGPAFHESVCPVEPCPEWIFPKSTPSKDHPTAKGYEIVATVVMKKLQEIVPGLVAPQPPSR